MSVWIATGLALFTWWFSTGLILYVIRRADRTGGNAYNVAVFFSVPVLALGVAGVILSTPETGVSGLYMGFLGALGIWAWIELAFLSGVITGPERDDCPVGLSMSDRFDRAWNALAHHELLLLAGLGFIIIVTANAANQIALWTYAILFFARISAKLNLFFGVPRINFEFLPKPLAHLKSHLRQGPVSAFYPFSVMLLSLAVAWFAHLWSTEPDAVAATGYALLTSLSALALLEHWFMLIPLPDAQLWRWMLPDITRQDPLTAKEDPHGL